MTAEGYKNGPVILLSYAHSGASEVQDLLAADTGLVCTSGTGILPLCAAAAETWRRVEGRDAPTMSRLAVASISGLLTPQITMILSAAGGKRWCELATAEPSTAQQFLEIFPHAVFVCIHRNCLDMIRAGVAASPWGLYGQGIGQYLISYPGNSVAALAAYWANCTDELLALEDAHPQITHRLRYEDAAVEPCCALPALKEWLRLGGGRDATFAEKLSPVEPSGGAVSSLEADVPVEIIPQPLRRRISSLHTTLGYAPLPG